MVDILGWAASIAFAVCAVPQAMQCQRDKHAHGMSWVFLSLWMAGEILSVFYVIIKYSALNALPLLANYVFSLVFISIILRWKIFPQKKIDELI